MSFLGAVAVLLWGLLAPNGESGSAFYTYLSDPVSKNFYRDVFVQKQAFLVNLILSFW